MVSKYHSRPTVPKSPPLPQGEGPGVRASATNLLTRNRADDKEFRPFDRRRAT